MPTNPTREDWTDWWPDEPTDVDELLTRQELVERAQAEGIDVTAQDVANWQAKGIVPRGLPHRIGRVVEMRYPPRYVELLRSVRGMQQSGLTLAELSPFLRLQYFGPRPTTRQASVVAVPILNTDDVGHLRRGDAALAANDELAKTLLQIAHDYQEQFGGRITRVELNLIDEYGNPAKLAVDTG